MRVKKWLKKTKNGLRLYAKGEVEERNVISKGLPMLRDSANSERRKGKVKRRKRFLTLRVRPCAYDRRMHWVSLTVFRVAKWPSERKG